MSTFSPLPNSLELKQKWVVEATHLKNSQIGSFPPNKDENNKYVSCHHPVNLKVVRSQKVAAADGFLWITILKQKKRVQFSLYIAIEQ